MGNNINTNQFKHLLKILNSPVFGMNTTLEFCIQVYPDMIQFTTVPTIYRNKH